MVARLTSSILCSSGAPLSTVVFDLPARDFALDLSRAVQSTSAASVQALLRDSASWHSAGFDFGATQLQLQICDNIAHQC